MASPDRRALPWVLLLAGLLSAPTAEAVNAQNVRDPNRVRTLDNELSDLLSGSASRRRFAARNLLKGTRTALRTVESRNPEIQAEALLYLEDMDRQVAPECMENLDKPELLLPCAKLLGLLETQAALPVLQAALPMAEGGRTQRAITAAIESIQAAAPVEPTP